MGNYWRHSDFHITHGRKVERYDDLDMASGVAVGTAYAIGLTLLLAVIAIAAMKAKGVI